MKRSIKIKSLTSGILLEFFVLSGCGDGSGGGTATATIQGQTVDGPLSNAKIALYSGGLSGFPIATTTADGNGNYSLSFTPSGSASLFLEASSNGNTLSSYIGNASSFSGTVSSSANSNLNITQVTTATLAVIANQGVSLSNLTPTTYGQQIVQLQNAIIQLAAVVQDVVDQTDSGCSLGSTSLSSGNLSTMLGSTPISSTTNVITTLSSQLSSCTTTTLDSLASQIPSNATIAPQLTSTAAQTSTTLPVSAGPTPEPSIRS